METGDGGGVWRCWPGLGSQRPSFRTGLPQPTLTNRKSHDVTSNSQNKEVPFPLSGIPPSAASTTITASSGPLNNPLTDWLEHVHQQQLTCKPAFNLHFFLCQELVQEPFGS